MDRRDFLRFLFTTDQEPSFLKPDSKAEKKSPPHECVDRPNLPRPACLKAATDRMRANQKTGTDG